jgi:uncharacterized protein (DUF1778 family)
MNTVTTKVKSTTTIRFDEYPLKVIDKAAELLNQTRTAFLQSVALKAAEQVIRERYSAMREIETLLLSPEASLDIAENLSNPPAPNVVMKKAMKDYSDLSIQDRS